MDNTVSSGDNNEEVELMLLQSANSSKAEDLQGRLSSANDDEELRVLPTVGRG